MKNSFYNDFDYTHLKDSKRTDDIRTPFQIDRDRIIYSSEFRRLQGKTQVFIPGEYDYYRTRLTHSIEVAQIGRSICYNLVYDSRLPFTEEFFVDPDLVEAICLAHDLGHPPFGHAGERTLNKLMKIYGGFEGNAQTLRLVAEILFRDGLKRRGMNPTRAFIDGILKYKTRFNQLENPYNHFVYNYQEEILHFARGGADYPENFEPGEKLNSLRSIECQIMDWADDTAYAINDIVDSILGGFINIVKLKKWQKENEDSLNSDDEKNIADMIHWIEEGTFKKHFGSLIGDFINNLNIEKSEGFLSDKTNRYAYNLLIDKNLLRKAKLYKDISIELVFRSPQIYQMELKGNFMIEKIFKVLFDNYVEEPKAAKLLPAESDKIVRNETDITKRARLVCDYVAGMTDSFAIRNYKRLFDPDYSSLIDFG